MTRCFFAVAELLVSVVCEYQSLFDAISALCFVWINTIVIVLLNYTWRYTYVIHTGPRLQEAVEPKCRVVVIWLPHRVTLLQVTRSRCVTQRVVCAKA